MEAKKPKPSPQNSNPGSRLGLYRSVIDLQAELEVTATGLEKVSGLSAAECRDMAYFIIHESISTPKIRIAFEESVRPPEAAIDVPGMNMLDGNIGRFPKTS